MEQNEADFKIFIDEIMLTDVVIAPIKPMLDDKEYQKVFKHFKAYLFNKYPNNTNDIVEILKIDKESLERNKKDTFHFRKGYPKALIVEYYLFTKDNHISSKTNEVIDRMERFSLV